MNILKTGRLIAERRTALGLTQTALAQNLGVTDKAVSKWERGKSLPDVALLPGLAASLRLSVIELLNGELSDTTHSSLIAAGNAPAARTDYARSVTVTPDPDADALVSPFLFGSNLEHTRSCIYQGLSAQMLRNRKFAGKPSLCGCAAEWFPIGTDAAFLFGEPYTRHAEHGYHMKRAHECNAQCVNNHRAGVPAGIGQHGLCVRKNARYLFAAVLKTNEPTALCAELTDHSGKAVYARAAFTADAGDWTRYEFELTPDTDDADADLRIYTTGAVGVCYGAVSLLPADNFHGMRTDVIELLREIGVKLLRWPGGNFAGEYCWFDGLLPVDMRAPFGSYLGIETQPHSMGYDFHEIATDDFIALCRAIGAQPFITINPCWNTPEENAAWVEYCNGGSDTEHGRLRMERGFAEPYNVQFWSLGNEAGYGHMEGDNSPGGYARIARENAEKMLAVCPHLSLCSSGPYPNREWAALSSRPLADIVQLVSLHHYSHLPTYTDDSRTADEYYACLAGIDAMRGLIRTLRGTLDDRTLISFDEWNVWYAWYRPSSVTDGIHAALVMHMFLQEADKYGVALACHFEAVNEGMIDVRPDGAELTAQGQVMAAMKQHIGRRLCFAAPDAAATADADGSITVTAVNASQEEEKVIDFSACGTCVEAVLYCSRSVLPPSRFAQQDILPAAQTGTLTLPPHSFALLRFRQS